ncbi:L-aspartate oxidase [Methylococcus mesophilus]|uniref:L-aspartate oxidase n=1 Tax=Methylococcus mesophilus TaxID=2993564 RepID=UPI00224B0D5D|nr:L-aspartate oxidase [Methylococcus mesophilus]UZR29353.1 L-aspartate oxidase [Methylococcus mesophilus]
MDQDITYDALIIGSGASGLSLALRLADRARVAVLSKVALSEGNTRYAQGGISAVLDAQDSLESHIEDTLVAGAGLCDSGAVRLVVSQGKECIDWLLEHGVAFTEIESTDGAHHLHLTREGGHTHRRVVHAADATGRAVESSLEQHARAHPSIDLFEHHNVIDLITSRKLGLAGPQRVLGAYALDTRSHRTRTFRARVIALATGGASKVYLYTSNPDVSTGDGIALAWRAGARVANMEFIQFHPTCLYHPHARSFLISEAVRGEGGRLLLPDGSPFMQRFDPRGELAPRDIVARAIDHEMKRLGADCVYLDISHRPADFIRSHFPTIHARCLELGIDMTRRPIPVVPAAHYTCGGVVTDRQARADISGLYAVGEVACTGLHGANRMASNSLLECLVFAKQASLDIMERLGDIPPPPPLPNWDESQVTDSDEEVVVSHNWDEIRRFMWDYVGIVRTDKRLQRALHRAELLKQEIAEYYGNFRVTSDLLELRNLVIVAELIIRSALQRKESRGLHFTLDYPERDETHPPQNTILEPTGLQAQAARPYMRT